MNAKTEADYEAAARARGWRIDNLSRGESPDVFTHELLGCAFAAGSNTALQVSEGWAALCDAERIPLA